MSRERVKEEEATTRDMFDRDNPKLWKMKTDLTNLEENQESNNHTDHHLLNYRRKAGNVEQQWGNCKQ